MKKYIIISVFILVSSFSIMAQSDNAGGWYKFVGNYDRNGKAIKGPLMSSSPKLVCFNIDMPLSNYFSICIRQNSLTRQWESETPASMKYAETKGNWHIYKYDWYMDGSSYVLVSLDGKRIRYIHFKEKQGRYTEYVYYGDSEQDINDADIEKLPLH